LRAPARDVRVARRAPRGTARGALDGEDALRTLYVYVISYDDHEQRIAPDQRADEFLRAAPHSRAFAELVQMTIPSQTPMMVTIRSAGSDRSYDFALIGSRTA
jgi:hypothetical protein